MEDKPYKPSLLTDYDIYLFKEGTHSKLYKKLGCHICNFNNKKGAYFAVWAPNADYVSVVGDFNNYNPKTNPMSLRKDNSGIWECLIEEIKQGQTYKYYIYSDADKKQRLKADPLGFYFETPPKSASIIWNLEKYNWHDEDWMKHRKEKNHYQAPISIYEVHLGSWKRRVEENNRWLTYIESAYQLAEYIKTMNYTHIELLPIMEHPFDGSWGYQVLGYFAPTSRYGNPQDFMRFVDIMHQNGIGVILDWVPSHFVVDDHGLANFDGTCLYEHKDPRKGFHPQWKSAIFNYSRNEVKAFLISSAIFWFDKYHVDGLRVDGVASMLYLDFGRENGQWVPNEYGGRENLEAIEFLKQLNKTIYGTFNDVITIAEESSAFPKVSWPVYEGGLGFGFKWNMGWMHDTLDYFKIDPIYRQNHHNKLTFSIWYAFSENFILPLSHDEVVHAKGSLINKMYGDEQNKFANLRALLAYMVAHPGKKLLFAGCEFGQWKEWNYKESLDWHLIEYPLHRGLQNLVADLNRIYNQYNALHINDGQFKGFEWIDANNNKQNILAFLRKGNSFKEIIAVVCNFSGIRTKYRLGLPYSGLWQEIFNSQNKKYNGWDNSQRKTVKAEAIPILGYPYSIELDLPSLSVLYFEFKP